jgi:glycosyltransferase 2 family protein
MKTFLSFVLKLGVTLGIFVAIFLEFGGGYVPVTTAALQTPGTLLASNPAYPGIVGRLKAKWRGDTLPPARIPTTLELVCKDATERAVFVRLADGSERPWKPTKHCGDGGLTTVFTKAADGSFTPTPLATAPPESYFRIQGFQLVPAEFSDIWREIQALSWGVFLPWFAFAMGIKLLGILANVVRWQLLLRGQGLAFDFRYLCSSYFIGRYFGIVTPSTMGLDGWRLYDTIRLTKRPVECTTALAVERLLGLVGLVVVILLFMPLANRLTQGQSFGEMVGALKIPLAASAVFGFLILLRPSWFRGLLRVVPAGRLRQFAENAIDAATAYSSQRGILLASLCLAVFGQLTTTLMYFGNAMAIGTQNVHPSEVLFASAVMTLGTFIAPSASGEGVREIIFVWLLGSKAGAAKAFLIGNLGFWIEKIPLSIPGGIILLLRKDPDTHPVTRADLERVRREATAATTR